MKSREILLIASVLSLIFMQISSTSINCYSISSDDYYQESVYDQGINLTVGVNNRYLKWYMNLTVSILVRGTANEPIPSSTVYLKIMTNSYMTFGNEYNITKEYDLWNRSGTIYNGSNELSIYITHVPTQQPYTLTAIFWNGTQTGPNVTYQLFIESDRFGIVSFETFIITYVGLIAVFGIASVLYKKKIIKIDSKHIKDNLQKKR